MDIIDCVNTILSYIYIKYRLLYQYHNDKFARSTFTSEVKFYKLQVLDIHIIAIYIVI